MVALAPFRLAPWLLCSACLELVERVVVRGRVRRTLTYLLWQSCTSSCILAAINHRLLPRGHRLKPIQFQLHTKILLGLLLGIGAGFVAARLGWSEEVSAYVKPVGQAFLQLIRMAVVPLVFASLITGVASMDDVRKLGRIGGKTVLYYLTTTAVAITFGLVLANTLQPGVGLPEDVQSRLRQGDEAGGPPVAMEPPSISETLLNVIPKNPFQALAEGNMLQLIFFALVLGIALTTIPGEKAGPVIAFFDGLNEAMIALIHLIMKLAPYGVFALSASIVGEFGVDILTLLLKYALVVIVGLAVYMVTAFSLAVTVFSDLGIRQFFRGIRPAQLIAFSTSSSSATLPVTMECAQDNLGVPKEIASLTLPLGATINMDGTALYQGVSALFVAQIYGMDLGIGQQLTIVLTATLASIGTAGAPAAGIMMLAIILRSIGVPLEGIALILGVERILDMCRTVVNVTGDACCAVVVSATEKGKA
jgi:Na+/H+-dicarboxylate symporter